MKNTTINKMKKIIVIAKNKKTFDYFMSEIDSEDRDQFVFASMYTLRGIEAIAVIKVGNYYMNKDLYELKRIAYSLIR